MPSREPDLAAVRQSFDDADWSTLSFPAGNLYNWLFMMVAKHYLISFRDEQAAEHNDNERAQI